MTLTNASGATYLNAKLQLVAGDVNRVRDEMDATADKKQTRFDKIGGSGRYSYIFDAAFEIVLKNAKDEAVTVKVIEPIPGKWQMQKRSVSVKR